MILFGPQHDPMKIERGIQPLRSITSKYIQILLWQDRRRKVWQVRVQHSELGFLEWGMFRERRAAEGYFYWLVTEWDMRIQFTKADSEFMRACGIADVKPDAESDALMLQRHPELGGGMLLEQIAEMMIAEINKMSPDEKAHLRAKLNKSVGIMPKSSEGKPS